MMDLLFSELGREDRQAVLRGSELPGFCYALGQRQRILSAEQLVTLGGSRVFKALGAWP